MNNYEVGKRYTMKVLGILQDNKGADYMHLQYEGDDNLRIYNILKYQYDLLDEIPNVRVVVKSVEDNGYPRLKQVVDYIYQAIYTFGNAYTFNVKDIKKDWASGKEYYELEDEMCVHRYYFTEDKYKIGDECTLIVKGLTRNGDALIFAETQKSDVAQAKEIIEEANEPTEYNNRPLLDLGPESTTLEYKTSIVFQNGEVNVDKQLRKIVQTIISFMNSDGGDLYIGITDKKHHLVGIEADLEHLNEGTDDFNGNYTPDADHYELKIRNAMEKMTQGVALTLVEFEFPTHEGIQYCHIKVNAAKRPVWMFDSQLYVRTGNRVTQLKKDDISNFIYERVQVSLRTIIDTEDGTNISTMSPEQIKQVIKDLMNEHRLPVEIPTRTVNPDELEYYIVWYNDRTWKRTKDNETGNDVFKVLPIKKADRGQKRLLFLGYKSGTVNEVDFSTFIKKIKLNILQNNGFQADEEPIVIDLVSPGDLMAIYSVDIHGNEYVKVHSVSDISTTQSAKNQGCRIVPRDNIVTIIKIVSGKYEPDLAILMPGKNKTTNEKGTPITTLSQQEKDAINLLATIKD